MHLGLVLHILIFVANHPNAVDEYFFFTFRYKLNINVCASLDFSQTNAFYAVQS